MVARDVNYDPTRRVEGNRLANYGNIWKPTTYPFTCGGVSVKERNNKTWKELETK